MSNAIAKKGYTPAQTANILITLALMFGFGYLPPVAGITPIGMKLLGVFLGVVYGYTACGVIWPSLMGMMAYGITGYTTMGAAITAMMGHNVVFQCICGFITAGALNTYGFGKWFVRWSLSLKLFKGKPMRYVWCFFVFFGLSCFFVNMIVLQIILYGVWNDIAENCGYEKGSTFHYYGFTGIVTATILGGSMCAKGSWALGLCQNWAALTGGIHNMGEMLIIMIPITVIILTAYTFAAKIVFKVDVSKLQAYDPDKLGEEAKVMRPRCKRVLIVYLTSTLLIVLGSSFAKTAFGAFMNNTLTTAGATCIAAALLMIIPSGEGDGEPAIRFNEVKNTAISWEVILMCACTITLAGAVTADVTGIVPLMQTVFGPVLGGKGPVAIIALTVIMATVLTNVGSNIAFGAALIPIIAPFVMETGMHPQLCAYILTYTVNLGLVLPGASAPASIYHGQASLPSAGKRYTYTMFSCLVFAICAIPYFAGVVAIIG